MSHVCFAFPAARELGSSSASFDVVSSRQIHAEPCRLLYALAMPEYMETWLRIPHADRIECYPEQRSYDRFRIDLFSAGHCRESIHGSCLLSKPNRITYLWERDPLRGDAKSLVEIHLGGEACRCTLRLRHTGLRTRDESERYAAIWRLSLDNLSCLMDGRMNTSQPDAPTPAAVGFDS